MNAILPFFNIGLNANQTRVGLATFAASVRVHLPLKDATSAAVSTPLGRIPHLAPRASLYVSKAPSVGQTPPLAVVAVINMGLIGGF